MDFVYIILVVVIGTALATEHRAIAQRPKDLVVKASLRDYNSI